MAPSHGGAPDESVAAGTGRGPAPLTAAGVGHHFVQPGGYPRQEREFRKALALRADNEKVTPTLSATSSHRGAHPDLCSIRIGCGLDDHGQLCWSLTDTRREETLVTLP